MNTALTDEPKIEEKVEEQKGREPFEFDEKLEKAAEEVKKIIAEENARDDQE